jgi:transcriptional regulator with XRE-family HTH domain
MHRKSSDRISAKTNKQGELKAMFAVDVFSPTEADAMARKMIERESRGYGDQMNAYEKVAERCGFTARQLRRFLQGEIKNPGFGLLHGIRIGFLSLWEEEVKKMQQEIDALKARVGDSDHVRGVETEAQALAHKIQAIKEQLRQ